MQIGFATERAQRSFESKRNLQRAHGQNCAKKVTARLADLEAADSLEEMRGLPGRCHELDGNRIGQLAVDLADGKRLVFKPDHNPTPEKEDGGLDWVQVDSIEILEIVDYH